MAIRAQGTTLKFTPKGKTQVTVGMLRSVGEIAPDSEEKLRSIIKKQRIAYWRKTSKRLHFKSLR